ncbi:MAG: 30S ribosomal protein S20 [Pseudomonadota bacterium]
MAHSPQARKRIRRNARRTEINIARLSRIRTFIKKVEQAIIAGDAAGAATALKAAQPELQRGVAKGALHKNAAARKVSRLARQVRAMASTPAAQ